MARSFPGYFIVNPPSWTPEQFRKWAVVCARCGNLCHRYWWVGGKGADAKYRCDGCTKTRTA